MTRERRKQILAIVATDSTFELTERDGERVWVGKCIHCQTRLVVAENGEPLSRATIEHIVPRSHGGTDDPENLALACERCNHQKGFRHDVRPPGDPRAREVIARLVERRRRRFRAPPA